MSVTPTGVLSLPLYNMQTLICNSATFRTWVGAATVAAARDRCYLVAQDETSITRPFAVVEFGGGFTYSKEAEPSIYLGSGSLVVWFEDAVASGVQANHADAMFTFTNTVGAILTEMLDLSGTSGYINIRTIRDDAAGPLRANIDETTDIIQLPFRVDWNPL